MSGIHKIFWNTNTTWWSGYSGDCRSRCRQEAKVGFRSLSASMLTDYNINLAGGPRRHLEGGGEKPV